MNLTTISPEDRAGRLTSAWHWTIKPRPRRGPRFIRLGQLYLDPTRIAAVELSDTDVPGNSDTVTVEWPEPELWRPSVIRIGDAGARTALRKWLNDLEAAGEVAP